VDDPWANDASLLRSSDDTHVTVRIGDDRYALALEAVAEIQLVPTLTRVPGVDRWVVGVANCRGRVLAVLDARRLLSAPEHRLGTSARLVVLDRGGVEAGLVVDAVEGLGQVGEEPGPVPPTVAPGTAALLQGVVDDHGPVALLDADGVLALGPGGRVDPAG
jgi:chemotaxis signal transduction protein